MSTPSTLVADPTRPTSGAGFTVFGDDRAPTKIPRWMLLVLLIVAQVIFSRFMTQQPLVGMIQAAAISALVLYGGVRRDLPLLLTVAAYIPGAEITWRQSQVPIPYLLAVYLLIGISVMAVASGTDHVTRSGRLALLYILLLIPASLVTYSVAPSSARKLIAFSLAGPAALAALVILFSQLVIGQALYRRLLWTLLISGVGPLTIALTAISDYIGNFGAIEFDTESNFITSGGFGPVQVSSVLGLSALVAVLLVFAESEIVPRVLAGILGLASGAQSLLTFSRGGMTATAIALAGLVIVHTRDREHRRRVLIVVGLAVVVVFTVIIPRLETFTGGKFQERFSSTKTGRTTLASGDFELFENNIWLGAGAGMSKFRRIPYDVCMLRTDRCNLESASHTEFTRMLAEHGLSGLAAIIVMGVLARQAMRRAGPSMGLTVTMILWSVAQMAYANLRVAAVPFAFAFGFLPVRDDADLGPPTRRADDPEPLGSGWVAEDTRPRSAS